MGELQCKCQKKKGGKQVQENSFKTFSNRSSPSQQGSKASHATVSIRSPTNFNSREPPPSALLLLSMAGRVLLRATALGLAAAGAGALHRCTPSPGGRRPGTWLPTSRP